jgi:hypothetical protein
MLVSPPRCLYSEQVEVFSLADRAASDRAGQDEAVSAFCLEMMSTLRDVRMHFEVARLKGSGDGVGKALALAKVEFERAIDIFEHHRAALLGWRNGPSDEPKG